MSEQTLSIYMAGKISRNDWRRQILNTRRPFDVNPELRWPVTKFAQNGERFNYTGPYFFSCDHGCYHGPNSHGWIKKAGESCGTLGNNYNVRSRKGYVTGHCLQAIRDADVFFAWIEDETCFGTLAEIGYAKACGKKVVVAVKDAEKLKNIWFSLALADKVVSATSPLDGFRQLFLASVEA